MSLVTDIYRFTRTFPKDEIYGLTSQLRRAAISIPSNIAKDGGGLNKGIQTVSRPCPRFSA
ncbi:MAG TPA: four helix bundle protein [Candidatus Sulfotelmatobacter sp.]|nr:four helix bundle protein [Candidatus Sulfotelmatobacter sp.]